MNNKKFMKHSQSKFNRRQSANVISEELDMIAQDKMLTAVEPYEKEREEFWNWRNQKSDIERMQEEDREEMEAWYNDPLWDDEDEWDGFDDNEEDNNFIF